MNGATVIHFNADTPGGRGIIHLLEKSALADMQAGLDLHTHTGAGRTLVVRDEFTPSDGECSLIAACESLAGRGQVNIALLLAVIDERSKRAVAESVLIAGGFRGATVIEVAS